MWWILGIWLVLGILANATVNGVRSYEQPENKTDERIIRTIKLIGYMIPPAILLFILLYEGQRPYVWVLKQTIDRIV